MDECDELEELLQKQRREKKDLQAKIQVLKKCVPKGDKKKKKEVSEEIWRLESEINTRHELELIDVKSKMNENGSTECDDSLEKNFDNMMLNGGYDSAPRTSKAQRRRERKVTQLKERELLILEQDVKNLDGARHLETEAIKAILKERGLMISEIPSDGNCLYNAVIHCLLDQGAKCPTLSELRLKTADFLRTHKTEYLPYISHPDTGNMLTENQFEEYCLQVANTAAWGGEIELRAISQALKKQIEVVQAKGPFIVVGEEYGEEGANIVLTYHRHIYSLGEHYNSTTEYRGEPEEFGEPVP